MNKRFFALTLALIVALLSFSSARAQSKTTATKTTPATASASTLAPLRLLPPSDFVAFVNVKRLITEAAPKVLADNPAKLAEFNAQIDKLKAQTGLDARQFENIAVGMRYQYPSPRVTTTDMVVIANGSFNANLLIAAGRLAAQGKYQEEKYNGATLYIVKVQDHVKMLGLFNMRVGEVAVTALDANTIAIGEPVSVRATVDAKAKGRVNDDLIRLATRSPNALVGFSANVTPELTASADINNAEISKIIGSIRQAYGAIGTTADGFDLLAVARTEKPEQAQSLSQMLDALKQFGPVVVSQLPAETGKLAQTALDNLKISSEGNEALVRFELKQADISTLMRMLQPKAAEMR